MGSVILNLEMRKSSLHVYRTHSMLHQLLNCRAGIQTQVCMSFSGGSDSKESACNAGVSGLILGLGRSPGEGNGNPLQYFCLENPMDRGAWRATVHGVIKSQTQLND